MSPLTSIRSEATTKQLNYIRSLAEQTGTTFTPPENRRQASCEIQRLKALKTTRGVYPEAPREGLEAVEQPYATEQKPGETLGYGSSARRRDISGEPAPALALRRVEGEPLELARYETRAGEKRALYGIRVDGRPRIIDAAAEGRGRIYTVEEDLCEQGGNPEVQGIVAVYIAEAERLGRVPMAKAARREHR